MGFHEVNFPTSIGYGSAFGPGFDVLILQAGSGLENRILRTSDGLSRYDVGYGVRKPTDLQTILAFFRQRQGEFNGFRFKDLLDFSSNLSTTWNNGVAPTNLDQLIGTGNGTLRTFQLRKDYGDVNFPVPRTIEKPVAGTVVIAVDGVSDTTWTLDSTTGIVTFTTAPPSLDDVTAGFELDVPVRFDIGIDGMRLAIETFGSGGTPSIPLTEIRNPNAQADEYPYGGSENWGAVSNDVQLSLLQGRTHRIAPTVPINAYLPDAFDIPDGAMHFWVLNAGGIGADITIRALDESTIKVLQPNSTVGIMLVIDDTNAKVWSAFG